MATALAMAAAGLWMCIGEARAEGHAHLMPDVTEEASLWTWNDPVPWRVGVEGGRMKRPVEIEGMEADWQADVLEGKLSVAPWGWLTLYGRVGAAQARLEGIGPDGKTGTGAGGALGLKLNLWEVAPGGDSTAWRVSIGLLGEYAWRTGEEKGGIEAEWGEAYFFLPINYHLLLHGTQRSTYATEAHSLDLFIGPACSLLDGTWTAPWGEMDFESDQQAGISGGLCIWLMENLGFSGRVDWFDAWSYQAAVEYRF